MPIRVSPTNDPAHHTTVEVHPLPGLLLSQNLVVNGGFENEAITLVSSKTVTRRAAEDSFVGGVILVPVKSRSGYGRDAQLSLNSRRYPEIAPGSS